MLGKDKSIEKPEDAIKDPYVLEFLGIPEKSYYTESQLEQKLIDHLHDFILELGKKFLLTSKNAEEYAGGKADDILAYCLGSEHDNNVTLKLR